MIMINLRKNKKENLEKQMKYFFMGLNTAIKNPLLVK
jgi:hypothetical protein